MFCHPSSESRIVIEFRGVCFGHPFYSFLSERQSFFTTPLNPVIFDLVGPVQKCTGSSLFVIFGEKWRFTTFDPGEMPTFGNLLIFVRVEPVPCFGALVWDSIFRTFLTESYLSDGVSEGCASMFCVSSDSDGCF